MDLGLSDSEQLVKETARSFVERFAPRERLVAVQASDDGYDPRWVPAMVDAGWLGMLVPASHGGSGASVLQTALVYEELGRGPVPGPWIASSVLGALTVAAFGAPRERDTLLPGIATGEIVLIPTQSGPVFDGGVPDGGAPDALRASRTFVPYAAAATHFLLDVPGVDGGPPRLVVVPRRHPRVRVRRLGGFIAWSYAVDLDDVPLADCTPLTGNASVDQIDRALDVARVVVAAYQVGGCSRLLDMSVDYSATRVQFGVPIGRFQRVQDHVVRIVNALDAARWSTYAAIWRLDTRRPAAASVSMAKALASEGYVEAANAAHEVHAGIGSDPSFGLTLFTQMSRSLYHYLGGPRWQRKRLGALLAAAPSSVG
ncbi:MAG TPA: acyl-CoA dehydrogenase family protein [Acidimicrobiales bacterium]|nr:acyl-CoA dehydrogenase family protein [Acidimicrobiales bacterium]